MIQALLTRLTQPDPAPLDDDDARVALTAILVRLARSDNTYGSGEIAQIKRVISRRYGLSPDGADALLHEAEQIEAGAPDTVRFTNAVKNGVPLDQRLAVIEAAWSVVLADGVRTSEEDALMRMIPRFLGITDRDSNEARLRATKALDDGAT
ncbi:TerB family tellurite resistance protein [Aliiroseovarius sediminis]|uniref:tellurite resistance TerB family protein n=1 Tax=Aliiroseovarius sediminis TaxID=2925839 RepID=UPI001F5A178B|nr:TerB family tellurite resistance protein [Aliiroseovarius sediminis]MCI2392920.1 TerB family tellurite resistance protein [Aliiroseovarius sediminis]